MKLEQGFLRSKVAKRVVWLLLLSALTPIVATTILSVTYVAGLLIEDANAQLHHASKLYGMSLIDKLLLIEDKLNITASLIESGQGDKTKLFDIPDVTHRHNRALPKKDKVVNSMVVDIKPASGSLIKKFNSNQKPDLYSEVKADGTINIFMRIILDVNNNTVRSLVAEINNEYLWGKKDRLPFSTFLCVIENNEKIVFCSEPVQEEFLNKVRLTSLRSGARNFEWSHQGEKHLAVQWELFIKSRFNGPRWNIISSKREAAALLPIKSFNKIFPLIILLSLLIVLFLSMIQIRNSMIPLERLVQGTKRILNKDFSSLVKVESNDEYADLANAFNVMTIKIGKQINALTVLSEIDRLILSNPTLDKVLVTLLNRAHDIISCDLIAIMLIDKQNINVGATYISDRNKGQATTIEYSRIPEDELNYVLGHNKAINIDIQTDKRVFLNFLSGREMTSASIFQVSSGGELRAIFTFAYHTAQLPSNEELGYIHDMVDRFGVALATADRDEKLYQQAHYDSLTGLPNRQLMSDRLEQNILHSRRDEHMVGLLYVDIDRFKYVNDSLGHSVGDELLKQIAGRMKECIRDDDTVSRLGGDEFVVILTNINNSKDIGYIAEHIVKTISTPFTIDSREIFVTPSIGITLYPNDGENTEELLKKADSAMYRAKENGRGEYVFFEEKMNIEDTARIETERDLRKALQNDEFELLYQPQINLQTGKITGAEALVRWNHPERGVVSPVQFISVLEDTGLIEPVGEWVLRTACQQFSNWLQQGFSLEYIAVNVSSRQFIQAGFLEIISNTLLTTCIQPEQLELEITESVLMSDQVDARRLLDGITSLGVKIAIDDFGTGYSSLSYLKRFPVNTLKIDRSFISDIPVHQDTTTIVSSIITMAHALNMQVVAEGIETKEQSDLLQSRDCNIGQGYYFSKPLSKEKLTEYLIQQDRLVNITR